MTMTKLIPNAEGQDENLQAGRKKSGYAKDVRPDLVTEEERAGGAVPVASTSGKQSGRLPPALRKTTTYKAVTAAEADVLLRDRYNGRAPRIPGGLDDPKAPSKLDHPTQYEDARMESQDSPDELPAPPARPAPEAAQAAVPEALVAQLKAALTAIPTAVPAPPMVKARQYERVQMTIEGAGTYTMPAIDVVKAGFGIFVLLPCGANDATFTPNPGASVRVAFRGTSYDGYFPGVAGELPGLGIMLVAMILKPAGEE